EDDPGDFDLTNEESGFERFLDSIMFLEEGREPPMWWTNFWAGVGTLLLAALVVVFIIAGVMGGIWVWHRQPLFLLIVPGLPMIALFGHYARDLLWSDPAH